MFGSCFPQSNWFGLCSEIPVDGCVCGGFEAVADVLKYPVEHPDTRLSCMEAQGGPGSPEPNKDIQKLLKPYSSGDLSKELFHCPAGEEDEGSLSGHTASLLDITEKRQPLSSVSSLEVHFDLLDLTELTDMSDQELAEVFADSDEENHNESPADNHHLEAKPTELRRMLHVFTS
ncbi:dysbindin domain-containing protein 1 isoform X2 [Pseudoliparis swirei]|uniref:dysbindin domain-containing protein 1 isoform X2 n=1 Tax=Pseudoliparis swirei TaxID=2059687 RepID=UPI0024BEAA87|nr:dysbindin domain-containing protein 1 isoform X2 [Pseudoliparis swirei]